MEEKRKKTRSLVRKGSTTSFENIVFDTRFSMVTQGWYHRQLRTMQRTIVVATARRITAAQSVNNSTEGNERGKGRGRDNRCKQQHIRQQRERKKERDDNA
ncbi:hypothetical protein PIB30_065618 [Stylosanthes scabra]|uniref:Uncharacterized protein n=1 Tax=Stylosanthes scabra TaxID=79078 RepID=A0ABU6VKJ6_9FABA|nr:hypothetical protein [Stylosanthes scabra]